MKARSLAHASTWAAAGVATSKAVSLATTLVLAHFVAPADFGIVALAAVATDLVQLVQDLGLSPALVQHRGDPRVAAAIALRLHVVAALALTLAIELAAAPLAALLGDPALASVMRVLALGTLVRGVALVPRALLQRELAFRALAMVDVAALIARAAVAIGLAWYGAGLWSLVAGDLTALAVQGLGAWTACGGVALAVPTAPAERAALLRFGRPMTLASVVVWARDGMTRALVGILLGPTELGYFHLAARIAGTPVTGITHVSSRVALPVYAAAPDRVALARAFLTTLRVVGALALPLAAVLLAVAPGAVALAFGPAWAPVVQPLRILLVASMASALAATTGELFKALGRPHDLLRTAVPHLGLLAIAIPLGATYGLPGVATAIACVRILMAIVALGIAARLTALSPRAFAGAVVPGLGASACALIAVMMLATLELEPATAVAVRMAAAGSAAALFLGIAWRVLSRGAPSTMAPAPRP